MFLQQKNIEQANRFYRLCIENSTESKLGFKCREGLLDVSLLQRKYTESLNTILEIEKKYSLDSVSIARLQAKKSQTYSHLNKIENANIAYQNSLRNLPQNADDVANTYGYIEQAKNTLLSSNAINNEDKIAIQKAIAANSTSNIPQNSQVIENLNLYDTYAKAEDFVNADKYISNSKKLLDANVDAELSAEVYKLSLIHI